jgi:hypothetical protein
MTKQGEQVIVVGLGIVGMLVLIGMIGFVLIGFVGVLLGD